MLLGHTITRSYKKILAPKITLGRGPPDYIRAGPSWEDERKFFFRYLREIWLINT
jgi:hypothetical protein